MYDSHTLSIFESFIDKLSQLMKSFCDQTYDFMVKYVINAMLNSIEDLEQENILGMNYYEFISISKDRIAENILSYLNDFFIACRGEPLSDEERTKIKDILETEKVVDNTICYLYEKGINNDGVPFIVIEGIRPNECIEKVVNLTDIRVRSRFSELAFYLSRLKQRFPDTSVFEAKMLVSRVFAFNEKRMLPLGKYSMDEVKDYLVKYIGTLYKKLCYRLQRRYPGKLLGCRCDEMPEILSEIISEFVTRLREMHRIKRLYEFQFNGIEKIIKAVSDVVEQDVEKYITLEASTGTGKSEVFLISSILISLIRKYLCIQGSLKCESPTTIVIYPRLALARDQFDRLVKYTLTMNRLLEEKGLSNLTITISLNNMEVFSKSDFWQVIENVKSDQALNPTECREKEERIRDLSVELKVCMDEDGQVYVTYTDEFNLFKCPNPTDHKYPKVYFINDKTVILCGEIPFNFIRIFKDDVKESPGDIHITLFETLRLNLWSSGWRRLFEDDAGGPIILVLDEIHTYTNITGARYSYMLRRIITRTRRSQRRGGMGFVVVGLSATIPNEDFLYNLFQLDKRSSGGRNIERVVPHRSELIPMGSDYFYIIVPNLKEPIDPLAVSIQTLMVLHFNMPEISRGSKKTLAFADSLDVVARLCLDLKDALESKKLHDLRNPLSQNFERTLNDYGDISDILKTEALLRENLPHLSELRSWLDGELWWPYTLECMKDIHLCDEYARVRMFTSKERDNIESPGIIASTSTLEVGVDYGDVTVIYQHGAPLNIASLIQRAGRGGRRVYLNPLLRNAIAIQISPELPHQAYLLELFMRSKSLREALKYERLHVAVNNEIIEKQTMAELMIDFYVYKGSSTLIDDISNFECEMLPNYVKRNEEEFLKYAMNVFNRLAYEGIKKLVNNVLDDIERYCESD
ncbi:MAG: helicase-related protein [Thermosphaera sp.]